jgi:hypothetical protein
MNTFKIQMEMSKRQQPNKKKNRKCNDQGRHVKPIKKCPRKGTVLMNKRTKRSDWNERDHESRGNQLRKCERNEQTIAKQTKMFGKQI